MDNRYRIGQVSNFVGISKDTIRHWQKKGLLDIKKDINDYNVFTDQDYYEIFKINFYRDIGLSISEIQELLKKENVNDKKDIIDNHIKLLNIEIEKLIFQRNILNAAKELPTSRTITLEIVKKTFKLKKVHANFHSNFSVTEIMKDKQLFITAFNPEPQEDYDVYIEVNEKEDFIYSHDTFIHFFYPKEKLVDNNDFWDLINKFSAKNNLTLIGEIIELHDLKQLFFNDSDHYIEFYVAAKYTYE